MKRVHLIHFFLLVTELFNTYVYVKIWNAANFSMVGSLPTTLEVRTMAISSELIYLGGKGGTVEIWDKEKQNRIDTLQTGNNCKVLCLALDANEEVLVTGTSDGRIRVHYLFVFIFSLQTEIICRQTHIQHEHKGTYMYTG